MISGKSSFCLIIFFLMCTGMGSMAQTTAQESKIVVDTLFNKEIRLVLPDGCKKQNYFYDEGRFIDYCYRDGCLVTLFKGSLVHTPILPDDPNHHLQSIDTINNVVIYRGWVELSNLNLGKRFWREDKIKDIYIYYDYVPVEKIPIFDNVLNTLSVKDITIGSGLLPDSISKR